jgi:ribonuclease HI
MIKIYTDGSCLGNPGFGGWAAIIFLNDKKIKINGKKRNTTNNQMELMAPIKALKKYQLVKSTNLYRLKVC